MDVKSALSGTIEADVLEVPFTGQLLLERPLFNKGTAFTSEERRELGLLGLLPPHEETLEEQVSRPYEAYQDKATDLERHIYLRQLQDTNETLFYRLLLDHLAEMMPIIYTPTVGLACERFSHIIRRPRGLFIAYPEREEIDEILDNAGVAAGRGDRRDRRRADPRAWATRGPAGWESRSASSLSTRPAGASTLPRPCRSCSTSGPITKICSATRSTSAGGTNGSPATSMTTSWTRSSGRSTEVPRRPAPVGRLRSSARQPPARAVSRPALHVQRRHPGDRRGDHRAPAGRGGRTGERLRDHRVAILGAGSAGCGIAEQLVAAMVEEGLPEPEARAGSSSSTGRACSTTVWTDLRPFQRKLAQPKDRVIGWRAAEGQPIGLLEVIENARPTILIGISGQPHTFTEEAIRAMAEVRAAADHLPALEPDLARRGDAGRPDRLDGRPRPDRHRQPVRGCDRIRAGAIRSPSATTATSSPGSAWASGPSGRGA